MANTSNTRKFLKLTEKVEVLNEIEQGARVTQLAKKYGVSKATICKIKRLKTQIIQRTSNSIGGTGKRLTLKNAKAPLMEDCLYKWFLKQKENHVSITGEILRERAKLLNEDLKETDNFVASDGWLHRFKTRYGIRLQATAAARLSEQPQLKIKDEPMQINELDVHMEPIYKEEPVINVTVEIKQENIHEECEDEIVPMEIRNVVTDLQAVEAFDQAIKWAEKGDVSYADVLVLQKLRAKALQDMDKCTSRQTKITDYFSG